MYLIYLILFHEKVYCLWFTSSSFSERGFPSMPWEKENKLICINFFLFLLKLTHLIESWRCEPLSVSRDLTLTFPLKRALFTAWWEAWEYCDGVCQNHNFSFMSPQWQPLGTSFNNNTRRTWLTDFSQRNNIDLVLQEDRHVQSQHGTDSRTSGFVLTVEVEVEEIRISFRCLVVKCS